MDDFELLNHYEVLGVAHDASPGDIDRAYRAALLREHPDRSDHPDANARASRVNEAGRVLLDPNRRRQYNPEADSRERRTRAGLRQLPTEREAAERSSEGGGDAQSHARMDTDDERYARVGQSAPPRHGVDQTAVRSRRVRRSVIASAVVLASLIVAAALVYQFVLRTESADFGQPGGGNSDSIVSAVADDQSETALAEQEGEVIESNASNKPAKAAGQSAGSDSVRQEAESVAGSNRSSEADRPDATAAQTSGSDESDEDHGTDDRLSAREDSNRRQLNPNSPYCQAYPDDEDCHDGNGRAPPTDVLHVQRSVEGGWHTLSGLELASISVGGSHSCGLRTDGSVVCWGRNDLGQANAPQGVSLSQVSAGLRHSCGLRTDGRVVCWGNFSLGDGKCGRYAR